METLVSPFNDLKNLSIKEAKSILLNEKILYIYYNEAHSESAENYQNFQTLSKLHWNVNYYMTDDSKNFRKFTQLCKEMINHQPKFQGNILIIQPDHKKCYFYTGDWDYHV